MRGPARAWSIAAMAVLCTVLAILLLRSPPPSVPAPAHPPRPEPEKPRPLTSEERRSMYRAWPLFEGWPLPQLPSDEPSSTPPPEPQKPPAPKQEPPPAP
ncbi:hypothetical protein [Myxococcus landrumensis]|uniref:hypothetical protein n=1 Tax=Myxococcus landrumensis TaxID=2813577 RepID=UPI001F5151C8|nr:hypothetical protein [Myxococcus landrumus]